MSRLLLAVLICATGIFAKPSPSLISTNSRIVGGQNATEGQFPYIVSLKSSRGTFCSGTILNEYWILTSALCMEGESIDDLFVVAGSHLLSISGEKYPVSKIIVHENWHATVMKFDIALMKVASPISFNDKVKPISLDTNYIEGDREAILCGWGDLNTGGQAPDNLQYVQLQTISEARCKKGLPIGILETNLCTYTHYGEGSCIGDSGGPLASDGKLIGVVSWGKPCAVGYPDVYTRVSAFIGWINENMS